MTTLSEFLGDVPDRSAEEELKTAWQAFEDGHADHQQARLIIRFLAHLTAYYKAPTIIDWRNTTGTMEGYETYCVEHQARRRVFANILPFLSRHPDKE